jgi:S-methylmethionine-dependent homocysteine/selenocysteine methylase
MKILKSLFLTMALSTFGLMAQDVPLEELPTATLNSDFYLTLDSESPVSNYYYVDISHLDFASEAELIKQCGYYLTANLITTVANYTEQYLVVQIHTEFLADGATLEQIQTYLNQLSKPL